MDFLGKGRTITRQCYSELLDEFDETLKETWAHLAEKKVLFHHVNAPPHSSESSQPYCMNCVHIAAAPTVLAQTGSLRLFFIPQHENVARGKKNQLNEQIIIETEAYFNKFDKSYFLDGPKKCPGCWEKCIAPKEDYVEK